MSLGLARVAPGASLASRLGRRPGRTDMSAPASLSLQGAQPRTQRRDRDLRGRPPARVHPRDKPGSASVCNQVRVAPGASLASRLGRRPGRTDMSAPASLSLQGAQPSAALRAAAQHWATWAMQKQELARNLISQHDLLLRNQGRTAEDLIGRYLRGAKSEVTKAEKYEIKKGAFNTAADAIDYLRSRLTGIAGEGNKEIDDVLARRAKMCRGPRCWGRTARSSQGPHQELAGTGVLDGEARAVCSGRPELRR